MEEGSDTDRGASSDEGTVTLQDVVSINTVVASMDNNFRFISVLLILHGYSLTAENP